MTNDSRLFRRRLALIGIGAVGIVGLALIAFWRNSPPPPTKEALAPIDWARSRALSLDMAKLLEETHRREDLMMERWMRLSPEERIDEKNISPEEKKRKKQELQEEMKTLQACDDRISEYEREVQEYMREQDEKLARTPVRERPKKANLRLVVETASVDLLPAQPLVTNIHLINDGQDAVVLRTILDSRIGFLKAHVKMPGAQDYLEVGLADRGEDDGMPEESAPSLNSGARWSFQTDLPLDLGYDRSTNAVVLGEYRVRLELDIYDRDSVVSDEFTVRVAAPTGDDEMVRRQIFASGLHGFLGASVLATDMGHLWEKSDENLKRVDPLAAMFYGFCRVVPMVEDLCLRFPNSRYAPDLRVGFIRAAMHNPDGVLAPSPEAKIDLERRIRVMCQTMMDRDGPKSWSRAEILLVAANCAFTVTDLPFTEKELHARFASLCPTDIRTPELIPSSKNMGPETDPLLGAEEELKGMTEDDKNKLREILRTLEAQK